MIELLDPTKVAKEYKQINKEMMDIKERYGVAINGHYVVDYPWIINKLPKDLRNLKIMDAGCGIGALQFYLWMRGAHVCAVDALYYGPLIKDRMARISKDHSIKNTYTFYQLGLGDEHPDRVPIRNNTFDYVVSCSALEHNLFNYFRNSILNCMRLLKPKGKLIITLPVGKKSSIERNMIVFSRDGFAKTIKTMSPCKLLEGKDNLDKYDKYLKVYKGALDYKETHLPGGAVIENRGVQNE